MSRKLLTVLLICIFMSLLEGCNQIEKMREEQDYESVYAETVQKKIDTPKTESFEIASKDVELKLKVAAQIEVPSCDKIPVVKAVEKEFTGNDLKRFSIIFNQDNNLEYFRGYDKMTKSELKTKIQEQTFYLDEILNGDYYSEDEKDEKEKEIEEFISKLQKYFETAPESVKSNPIVFKLSEDKEKKLIGINSEKFYISGIIQGESVDLFIDKGEGGNKVEYFFCEDSGTFQGFFKGYQNLCIYSEGSAKTQCEDFMEELGWEKEFELAQVLPLKDSVGDFYTGYRLIYKRKMSGIVETFDQQGTNLKKNYENLVFEFGTQGMTRVLWEEPMEIKETIVDDVEIIPYDRVIEIFKDRVFSSSNLISSQRKEVKEYYVDKIVLGLMRVSNPDNSKEFCYIPVWDFYNTEDTSGIRSYLTINAIDGSLIDRNLGY